MKNIHYIAHYGKHDNNRNLNISSAGISKMSYIITSIKKAGFNINVLSTAPTRNRFWCHYKWHELQVDTQEKNIYIDIFGSNFRFLRGLSLFWIWIQMLYYIFLKVKKNDTILIYHSCFYMIPILIAKKLKNIHLVIEVEEIYNASLGNEKPAQEREIRYLKIADSYILVNDLMAGICGFSKPYITSYGNYLIPQVTSSKESAQCIHLVYAGIIEKIKYGAFIAVECARFLTEEYKVHILGFGEDIYIKELKSRISEVNQYVGREAVIYYGSMHGEEYSRFLAKCHFGLSTHINKGDYVDLTFPSKLLVYIAHHLIPVCSRIACVEKSKIAQSVVFYNGNEPRAVAEAVMSTKLKKNTSQEILNQLDQEFISSLKNILD